MMWTWFTSIPLGLDATHNGMPVFIGVNDQAMTFKLDIGAEVAAIRVSPFPQLRDVRTPTSANQVQDPAP